MPVLTRSVALGLALLLALPAAAYAQPIVTASGNKWTPLPSTVRSYKNLRGTMQSDMQFSYEEAGKPGTTERHRWGVTGCAEGFGDIGQVQNDIMMAATPWANDGPAAADAIAAHVCRAAAAKTK